MPNWQIFVKIVASGGFGPPLVPYDGVSLVKLLYNSLPGIGAFLPCYHYTNSQFEPVVGFGPTTHGL